METSDSFRVWLAAQSANTVVGIRAHCGRCPLAEYLRAITHHQVAEVVGVVTYGVGSTWYDLPHWAQRFVARLDDLEHPFRGTVTAGETLRVLDEVTQ